MRNNLIVRHLTDMCGLNLKEVNKKSSKLECLIKQNEYTGLPIFVGYDINGPLVSTKEASMVPYQGIPQSMRFLSLFPKVELSLVTGWDNTTAKLFASKFIGLPDINIVSEKGMIFEYKNKLNHLYPHNEAEIKDFANSVFDIASRNELQIAIQPNISSGCQCVYFEGFTKARLNKHPLFEDIIPDMTTLCNQLNRRRIKFLPNIDHITINSSPVHLFNMLKNDLPLFPIRILGSSELSSSIIKVLVDPKDKADYDEIDFKKTVKSVSKLCDRSFDLNNDFSADFFTKFAIKSGFSKDLAIKALGKTVFNDSFLILNIGDKKDDRVVGDKCLFFPQEGSEAIDVKYKTVLPVKDGNEYSIIIGNYLFILDKKEGID